MDFLWLKRLWCKNSYVVRPRFGLFNLAIYYFLSALMKRKPAKEYGDSQSKRHRTIKAINDIPIEGILVMKNMELTILDTDQAKRELNLEEHQLRFTSSVKIESSESVDEFFANLKEDLIERFREQSVEKLTDTSLAVDSVLLKLREVNELKKTSVKHLLVSWRLKDEPLGCRVLEYLTPSSSSNDFY